MELLQEAQSILHEAQVDTTNARKELRNNPEADDTDLKNAQAAEKSALAFYALAQRAVDADNRANRAEGGQQVAEGKLKLARAAETAKEAAQAAKDKLDADKHALDEQKAGKTAQVSDATIAKVQADIAHINQQTADLIAKSKGSDYQSIVTEGVRALAEAHAQLDDLIKVRTLQDSEANRTAKLQEARMNTGAGLFKDMTGQIMAGASKLPAGSDLAAKAFEGMVRDMPAFLESIGADPNDPRQLKGAIAAATRSQVTGEDITTAMKNIVTAASTPRRVPTSGPQIGADQLPDPNYYAERSGGGAYGSGPGGGAGTAGMGRRFDPTMGGILAP